MNNGQCLPENANYREISDDSGHGIIQLARGVVRCENCQVRLEHRLESLLRIITTDTVIRVFVKSWVWERQMATW